MELSIIIVSWNTKDLLRDCLNSVFATVRKLEFEAIVVDNDSGDGSADMVEEEFPQARLIRNSNNAGFAKANNQGIEISSGDLILFLNPDTIVHDNALEKMADTLRENHDLGAVGPALIKADGSPQISYGDFPTIKNMMVQVLPYNLVRFARLNPPGQVLLGGAGLLQVDYAAGACLMTRRDIVNQVGPFDERFFAYFEETDFCHRLRLHGWKVAVDGGAEVVHLREQSLGQLGPERAKIFYGSLYKYFRKNKGWLKTVMLRIALALTSLLVIALIPLAFLSSNYRAKIKQIARVRWVILKISVAG